MNASPPDNAQLIAASLAGDHDAFRQIVEQHQNLICALALSACGNVAKSEDLAQETFLIAWQRLQSLHDPSNLKAWLCGIVRNLARNARRKSTPLQIDSNEQNAAEYNVVDQAAPAEELAASREEFAIVERALSAMPDAYREPLVLFYREEQSVQNVADALGLSPSAVRQRLTRGRSMLRDRVAAVIEHSLHRTKPTTALTLAIMAALPGTASQANAAVVAGVSTKTIVSATKPFWGWSLLSAAASPLLTLATLPLFARLAERAGKSPQEKQFLVRFCWQIGAVNLALALAIAALTFQPTFITSHPAWFGVLLGTGIMLQIAIVAILSLRADRRLKQIRIEQNR